MSNPQDFGNEPESVSTEISIALTLNQACRQLLVSRPTVVGLIQSEQIHAVKVGRKWLVSSTSLRRFVEGESAS